MSAIVKKVEALRAQIAALHSERDLLESQQRSRAEVVAYVHEYAQGQHDEFAQRARLALGRVAADSGTLDGVFSGVPMQFGRVDVAMPLAGVLGPDALAAALLAHIECVPEGLRADQRADRLATINSKLNGLELAEEALIEQAEEAGAPVARRRDARPEIVIALPAAAA